MVLYPIQTIVFLIYIEAYILSSDKVFFYILCYCKPTPRCRGGKIKITPAAKSGYPTTAWYTYADTSCKYGCQAIEYLWWGYAVYSGSTKNQVNDASFKGEYSLLTKNAFTTKDLKLAKLYQDSEKKTAAYRLPTNPADGKYHGCKICKGGKNHGGN